MLYALAVLQVTVIIVTIVIILKRSCKRLEQEQFRVKEISMTAILGLLLWIEAAAVLYCGIALPGSLVKSTRSYWNTVIFVLLSILLGAVMLLYYFVKCCILCSDRIISVSIFGTITEMKWNEIYEVQPSTGKRLSLMTKDATKKIVLGGEKSICKKAICYMKDKVTPKSGKELLF